GIVMIQTTACVQHWLNRTDAGDHQLLRRTCLDGTQAQAFPPGSFRGVPGQPYDVLYSRRLARCGKHSRFFHGQRHDRRSSVQSATAFHLTRIEPVVHRPAAPALMPIGQAFPTSKEFAL
ncbi:hypothetical protein, partial [Escherichia coli]|uniref:hypothetical protein n=1 Tax=Escherichia coli TaxID=562 RepID=UPI003EB7AEE1